MSSSELIHLLSVLLSAESLPFTSNLGLFPATSDKVGTTMQHGMFGETGRPFEAAFPDRQDAPAMGAQLFGRALISYAVRCDLRRPEVGPRRGKTEERTLMSMPEAAVHENYGLVAREGQVRPAGQFWRMEPEAQAERMEAASEYQLRFRVTAANAAHVEPPLGDRQNVSHRTLTAHDTILQAQSKRLPQGIVVMGVSSALWH